MANKWKTMTATTTINYTPHACIPEQLNDSTFTESYKSIPKGTEKCILQQTVEFNKNQFLAYQQQPAYKMNSSVHSSTPDKPGIYSFNITTP